MCLLYMWHRGDDIRSTHCAIIAVRGMASDVHATYKWLANNMDMLHIIGVIIMSHKIIFSLLLGLNNYGIITGSIRSVFFRSVSFNN
jgi:hypothetical protein